MTRTRLPREERERHALAVAKGLFAERGYGAVTMDDVAAGMGVTKPLLYTYFGNKEQLFLACMQPAGESLVAHILAAVRAAEDPADALRRGLRAFFAFLDADREAWRVVFDETAPAANEVAAQRERLTALVAETLLSRLPPEAAVEVEALSAALLGAAEALGRWWLRTGAISAADAAELLISTVEPGLRRRTRT